MNSVIVLMLLVMPPQLVDRTRETGTPLDKMALSAEEMADIQVARKMYREAVDAYKRALTAEPDSHRLHNKLGIVYHHLSLFREAKRSYKKSIKLDGEFAQPVNNLGAAQYAEERFKKAAKTYRKALKIDPSSASIHSNLGTAYFRRRKFKKASEEFVRALELDAKVFERRGRGGSLLLDRSVRDRANYFYFMARAYAGVALYDRALLSLRRAFEDGFRKRKKVLSDPLFEPLLDHPEFQALVGTGPQRAGAGL